jgi:hypothetical protein
MEKKQPCQINIPQSVLVNCYELNQACFSFSGSPFSDCSFVTIEKPAFETGNPVESVFNYDVRFWARAYLKMMDKLNQTNKTMVCIPTRLN